MLDIIRSTDRNAIDRLLRARTTSLAEAEAVVRPILDDIRRQGDRALRRYAAKPVGPSIFLMNPPPDSTSTM